MSVAFAVASALTTKISFSDPPVPPKSVIVSVPRSTLKRSFPAFPVKLSFTAFPVIISAPPLPVIVSFPIPPIIVSAPDPPFNVSAPVPPLLNKLQKQNSYLWLLKYLHPKGSPYLHLLCH